MSNKCKTIKQEKGEPKGPTVLVSLLFALDLCLHLYFAHRFCLRHGCVLQLRSQPYKFINFMYNQRLARQCIPNMTEHGP